MLKPKSSLLQIRVEPELLERFRNLAESRGMTISVALRDLMQQVCQRDDATRLAKRAYSDKQKRS